MDDGLIECLKECNLKLDALKTTDYRFVAWIIFSAKYDAFIAGVDTYSNDDENLQDVAVNYVDVSPMAAMTQVHMDICDWEAAGEVPFL